MQGKFKQIISLFTLFILMPATILWGVYCLNDRKYYFISLLIIIYIMIPFFMLFEKRKPQARELVLLATLTAIAVAGRSITFMIPQCKPVMAIVIISGVMLGGECGFLIGAMSAFVSNFFFGQGPWTPWQMFSFGMIGFLAGIIFSGRKKTPSRVVLCIFGFAATIIIFGGIMNPASVLMGQADLTRGSVAAAYIAGAPFDVQHGIATAVYLVFLADPICEKLERMKKKYGVFQINHITDTAQNYVSTE